MRKLLNKPWFVAVLAIAAVALVAQSFFDRGPAPRRGRAAVAEEPADEEVPAAGTSLAAALRDLALPDALPDPFAPRRVRVAVAEPEPERGPGSTETVRLTAVWEQGGACYLLVNGRICRPGDAVGRITIASVEDGGVWLAHWRGRDFLRLGQSFTLVTPAEPAAQPSTAHHEG